MSNHISITGRLADDPELRFTNSGKAVTRARVLDTPRRLNQQTNQWEDAGETLGLTFSLWDRKAEALAGAAHKGDLVTVTGELTARSYDAQDGTRRTVHEIKAREAAIVPRAQAKPRQTQGEPWGQAQPAQQAQGNPWGGQPGPDSAPF